MRRIAVTSQNRIAITGHAGRCRRFWIYEVEADRIVSKDMLEIGQEETFHAAHPRPTDLLGSVEAMITGGMGQGLSSRLAADGVRGLITSEEDPDRAIALYLAGTLPVGAPHDHGHRPDRTPLA